MSQITLTSGSPPAILSKNYINRDSFNNSGITVSSNDAIKDRIYDMTPASLWASAGSSEGAEASVTVTFYEGANIKARSVDFIMLLGNNFKTFIVEYQAVEAGAWATFNASADFLLSDNAETNFVLSVSSSISMVAIRVRCTNTIGAVAEKQLGVFVAALGTFQTANSMSKFVPKTIENIKSLRMLDGTYEEIAIYRDAVSFTMREWSVMWRFVSDSERNNWHTVRTSADPFLWYPEPGEQVEEIYLSRIKRGSFKEPYSTTFKTAGRDISHTIVEVGGA